MIILSGTDFTGHAAEAAEVAAAFSVRTGEPLLLVHAFDGASGAEAALDRLRAEADRLRALFPNLHVETQLEAGIPDEVLTGTPRLFTAAWTQGEQSVRLIVVSSLGRRAPARWVLGSVAERTAQTSPVPVLVVRDAKPFVSWLRGERVLRVVVGFDFSETSTAALRWVSELSRVAPCEVVIGHVTWPPEERRRSGAHWAIGAFSNFSQLETLLRSDVDRRLREHAWKEPPAIRVKISQGRRAPSLAELAAEEKGDLLVVGSRQVHGPGRLWQETVSRGALYHASMSVACVPIPASASRANPAAPEPPRDEDEEEVSLTRKLEAHPFLRGASGDVLRRLASIAQFPMEGAITPEVVSDNDRLLSEVRLWYPLALKQVLQQSQAIRLCYAISNIDIHRYTLDGRYRQVVEPYYVMWQPPGSREVEFILMQPYTPKARQELIGWIAAMCHGDNYGRLVAYRFPKDKWVPGPQQVEEFVPGHAAETLTMFSTRPGVRLMIVSSLGKRAPGRWLLGSVAERVARLSPVPFTSCTSSSRR